MRPWNVLVVDDEPLNLEIITDVLDDDAYVVTTAMNGELAWQAMLQSAPDLVVLDRMMPVLNGLELLKRIKADDRFAAIPVVMQTAASSPEQVKEGMDAGAWYYLTKPYSPRDLLAVIRSVLEDVADREAAEEVLGQADISVRLLESAEFSFYTLDHARHLAGTLAALCPDPAGAAMGLTELMVNAVEHGNLGITYAEKSQLRRDDKWEQQVATRLADPILGARRAHLSLRRTSKSITFVISDEGGGFDWTRYLDFDSARAFDPNGRGIAMACHACFSSVEYQGCGNVVTATLELPENPDSAQ